MGTANTKHIHKYMRQQLKHVNVWRCGLPTCNHWMPPNLEELLLGRASICNECGVTFPLDEDSMLEDMPRCFKCRHKDEIIETPFGEKSLVIQYLEEKARKHD